MSHKPDPQNSNGRHLLPKQLEGLAEVSRDPTDDAHGTYYGERSIEQLLRYGLIILDKPP